MDMMLTDDNRHSGKPSVAGYNKGCRCQECTILNTKKVAAQRKRSKESTEDSVPVISESVRIAYEDLAGILEYEPGSVLYVSEGEPGELAELVKLIRAHNSKRRSPRLECSVTDDDTLQVTIAAEAVATPRMPAPQPKAEPVVRVPSLAQLPRTAPLARPRNVPLGLAPTVPLPASDRDHDDTKPVAPPAWG